MPRTLASMLLGTLLLPLATAQAQEPNDEAASVQEERASVQPRARPETTKEVDPRAKSRRMDTNPYSLKNKPRPALNSPYSRRGRTLSIQRNQQGRAMGYSIRRPDGRIQYREFQGRGRKPGLPHAWQ